MTPIHDDWVNLVPGCEAAIVDDPLSPGNYIGIVTFDTIPLSGYFFLVDSSNVRLSAYRLTWEPDPGETYFIRYNAPAEWPGTPPTSFQRPIDDAGVVQGAFEWAQRMEIGAAVTFNGIDPP
jgi:hypothetical protein